ncbi:MAG: hypothetical protein ACXWL2_03460 [Candidatus Chromulinivorax sp.]
MKFIKLFFGYFLIFEILLIAENQNKNQKQNVQQQKPVQQIHKQVQSGASKVNVHTKPQQNEKKQSTSNVHTLVTNFTKAVKEIPEKKVDRKDTKKVDGKEYAKVTNIKEYRQAVDKAYKAYQELYKEKDNTSITAQEHKQIKRATIKLFDCKNIQNMVWPKEKMMKNPDQKQAQPKKDSSKSQASTLQEETKSNKSK